MMQDLTVSLIQTDLFWEDIPANLNMFDTWFESIPDEADLVALPEMFTTGFSMNASILAQTMDGVAVQWMRDASRRKQVDVVGSMIVKDGDGYRNRLLWVRPEGGILYYDKRHLFRMAGEEKIYRAGEKLLTVILKGWKIRPFVCYDLRFPVWTRNIDNAYDAAIFVANWPDTRSAHWRTLLRARAIENQAYVIGVNRVGADGGGRVFSGDSAVVSPGGDALVPAHRTAGVYTVRLSAEAMTDYRESFPAWMDADRNLSELEPLLNNNCTGK
jgi:predicted amidohydrolase